MRLTHLRWARPSQGVFVIVPLMLICLVPRPVAAQAQEGSIRVGPLGLTPSVNLTNVGIDTNVLNDPRNPQQDFMATFNPSVRVWLRAGSSRVTGSSTVSAVYFREFASQRAVNTSNDVRWEVPFWRVLAYAYYADARGRSRPNQEIDDRVQHGSTNAGVGTTVRLGRRTSLVLEGQRARMTFDEAEEFLGTNLSQSLDRTMDSVGTSFRLDITPLTTILLTAEAERDRFDHSPQRNSTMRGLMPGIEFGRAALITGSAHIGYRKFDMADPLVLDYSGLTANLDLAYVLLDRTRFATRIDRDLVYSFNEIQPYYVQSGVTASVTQQIASAWDLSFIASRHTQDYDVSTSDGGLPASTPEVMTQHGYQITLGCRVGRGMRTSVNVAFMDRIAGPLDTYRGTRVFSTVGYDF